MTDLSVCFTSPFSIKGSTRLYSIARELGKLGVDVTIILPKYDKYVQLKKNLTLTDFKMRHPLQFRSKNLLMSLLPYIPSAFYEGVKQKVDVVQIFKTTPLSALPGSMIAFAKHRPFVIDCDDFESSLLKLENYPFYLYEATNLVEKSFPKWANGVVAGAFCVKREMLELGIAEDRILLMPNGVDPDRFNPNLVDREQVRSTLGLDCPTVVYVGFFDQGSKKDFFLLLNAAKLMHDMGAKVKFLIVGDGKAISDIKSHIRDLKLDQHFIFTGFADPVSFIAAADVAVVPYIRSPLHGGSQKLFEYMSMAKAVVVTDAGELSYHVDNGKAGIVSKSEPNDLAEKLLLVLSDSKLQHSLGKAARERVLQCYTWKSYAENLLNFYTKIS